MIVMAMMGAVTGKLSDKFGPRAVLPAAGAFMGIGFCLMSILSASWQMYLFYGVMVGIGSSTVGPAVMSTISRWFAKRRGLAIAIVASGAGIGGVIFAPLSAWLIQDFDWRNAYFIMGIICLIFMATAASFLRRNPQEMGQVPNGTKLAPVSAGEKKATPAVKGLSLREAMHTPSFWIFACILLCFGLNRGIVVHIAPHVTDIGYSLTTASTVLAVNAGVSIAGRLAMGQLADMIGGRRCIIIAFVLMPLAFLTLLLSHELWALYLFAVLFGLSWGGLAVLRFVTAGELFGTTALGSIMGIVEFFATAGSGVGPILGGAFFDASGNYQGTFMIFAIVAAIGFITSLFLRPARKLARGGN